MSSRQLLLEYRRQKNLATVPNNQLPTSTIGHTESRRTPDPNVTTNFLRERSE
jgi:hypothetical protein